MESYTASTPVMGGPSEPWMYHLSRGMTIPSAVLATLGDISSGRTNGTTREAMDSVRCAFERAAVEGGDVFHDLEEATWDYNHAIGPDRVIHLDECYISRARNRLETLEGYVRRYEAAATISERESALRCMEKTFDQLAHENHEVFTDGHPERMAGVDYFYEQYLDMRDELEILKSRSSAAPSRAA